MPGFEVIGSEEFEEVREVFENGAVLFRHGFDHLRNGSFKVREFEKAFAAYMGSEYSLAVTSGTAALRVALAALGVGRGDEVITQSFTFVATAEAIIETGAIPVCCDIDATLNLDPDQLESKITSRTKAVIAVHMLGTPARLDKISAICKRRNLFLIEDTAWGCGGSLSGVPLGTWGDVGTFSFDFAKTMTTGEGGMLLFNDGDVYRRAMAWHDHGHENNPAYPRWEDTRSSSGFNYRMMELQGAIGLAQLRKLPHVIRKQRENRAYLWRFIEDLEGIYPRDVPEGSFETADALVFFVRDAKMAKRCRDELLKVNFSTKILPEAYSWHFAGRWNHMPELINANGGDLDSAFRVSHELLSRAVALPVGVDLDRDMPGRTREALVQALKG